MVTAHALGFGIYRKSDSEKESGLVQMFDQSALWEEIGYNVADGLLEDNGFGLITIISSGRNSSFSRLV